MRFEPSDSDLCVKCKLWKVQLIRMLGFESIQFMWLKLCWAELIHIKGLFNL